MNTKFTKQLLASLVVLSFAGSAFAEMPYPPNVPFKSTKTRAEVRAEVVQAQKAGLLNQVDTVYPILETTSKLTKAQIAEENSNKTAPVNHGE
ncbi:DUF4148 domain-containing protein [Glaciimonas soli]|uniref:DUF4148 domain-containing protein n=1 Tax=Glaciimonas soli TaxID=2590999 RepID=A0A843YYP9_9BURK|nr:DUF4148 domain-containing protein [Glaciimonas soli]MQR02391.1 DUF4148 domain-containing protein [Glaciimonas soli]